MKDKSTAGLLALFLGGLGVHKFYLSRTGQGILYLIFCWTFVPLVISFFEAIIYFTQSKYAFDEKYNYDEVHNSKYKNRYSAEVDLTPLNIIDELDKLHTLKEKGAISEDEYTIQKKKLLNI